MNKYLKPEYVGILMRKIGRKGINTRVISEIINFTFII